MTELGRKIIRSCPPLHLKKERIPRSKSASPLHPIPGDPILSLSFRLSRGSLRPRRVREPAASFKVYHPPAGSPIDGCRRPLSRKGLLETSKGSTAFSRLFQSARVLPSYRNVNLIGRMTWSIPTGRPKQNTRSSKLNLLLNPSRTSRGLLSVCSLARVKLQSIYHLTGGVQLGVMGRPSDHLCSSS